MDRLLRPGMRLLRRFSVTGKFVAIALVLLVPLSIVSSGSVSNLANRAAMTNTERAAMRLIRPLVQLLGGVCWLRVAEVTGNTEALDVLSLINQVDAAEEGSGGAADLHQEWARTRTQVISLMASRATPTGRGEVSDTSALSGTDTSNRPSAWQVSRQLLTLIGRVGNSSGVLMDPGLATHYLARALTDRLPAVLDSAATLAEQEPASAPTQREGQSEIRELDTMLARLIADLTTAASDVSHEQVDAALRGPSTGFQDAIHGFETAVTRGRGALVGTPDPVADLTSRAATLAGVLAASFDQLSRQRQRADLVAGGAPLLVGLFALLVAAYLFAALARATSSDARQVLVDINTVTTGALYPTRPLPGADEFAQMSGAVVEARDRLTSLLSTLRYRATHDELTALANRELFTEKLSEALEQPGYRVTVVVVDLDGFKDVNDSFGHAIGDRLLRALGARFHRAARRRDLVARLGADQFGVLLDATDERRTEEVVQALIASLEQPVDVDGRLLRVRARVGIATTPSAGSSPTEVMRNADVALHVAKRRGTHHVAVFEPAMHAATRERTELSFELVQAVEHGQLSVVYQPIVDLATDTVHGVEALVRWQHPVRGLISPTVFVPLAEATGLIVPIGRWVMREAVTQVAAWHAEFPDGHPLTMDINLSADQLGDPTLVSEVLSLISETGVDPELIVLEITESALMHDLDTALRRLGQLAAMGVRLALDDFGTGYSSLSYLRRLPVTVLKIDKSFVTDNDEDPRVHPSVVDASTVMLRGIMALGTGLGMQIVAEGIENRDQIRRLRSAGCHLGQGYLWSRPLPADDVRGVLYNRGRLSGIPRQREDQDGIRRDAARPV